MYYIVQCRGGSGVCPDDLVTANGGGSQDIFDISGRVTNGQTCVQYSRNLTTGVLENIDYIYMICIIIDDRDHDRPILDDQSQFVVWAYGPRAVEEGLQDLALFHTEWPRNGGELHFSLHFDCMHVTSCMQLLFQKM